MKLNMGNVGKNSAPDDRVMREASDWLIASQDGALDLAAERELSKWLSSSEQHMHVYNRLAETWDMMTLLEMSSDTAAEPAKITWSEALAMKWDAFKGRAWPNPVPVAVLASVAATVSLVMVALPPVDVVPNASNQEFTLRLKTQVGQQTASVIADGSILNLNTDTELTTHFSPELRRVNLLRGEVEFNVTANVDRPFVINVGSYNVTVLGTVFAVKKMGADIEVLVTSGTVSVQKVSEPDDAALVLQAGQAASAHNNSSFAKMDNYNAEQSLAWTKGLMIFDSTPLADVVQEMSRYDDRHILVRGSRVASIRVSGVFRIDRIGSALDAIMANNGLRVDYSDGKRLVLHTD